MVFLNWKGKKQEKEIIKKEEKSLQFKITDIHPSSKADVKKLDTWQNLLIYGENKAVMTSLLANYENKISLIYIDPPFKTGGDFILKIPIGENDEYMQNVAYEDKWREGLASYLNFLYERLIIMKKLLANIGSIYLHLDWHISHYAKLIMDEIFGPENFRNEIIWAYPAASVKTRKFFIRSYDTVLFYSKSDEYIFNDDPNIYMEYSDRVKNALKQDEKGTFYYRGGSHDGKKLSRKVYVEQDGIFPRDVWKDIPYIRANTSEYQGFSTQKPERLLKRIILASSNKNDIVADFFCGSGTTLAVAEKLGRHWIGCDSNRYAIQMTRKRILDISKSKDVINWKNLYNKNYSSFRIEAIDKFNDINRYINTFLNEDNKIKEESKIEKFIDFEVKIDQRNDEVSIELKNYKFNFIDLVSESIRTKIKNFSDWIDYWAIDFNSKSPIFTNMWHSYRTPKNRRIRINSNWYKYQKSGKFLILVKVIDIFGIETIKKYEIKIIL
ncbi:MAG: site-specific DNA-methyltransferase [Candidatus Thorarchaeota archaeon]